MELIGMEAVEKCFTEYMMLTIAKAKKYDETQGLQSRNAELNMFGEDKE